MYNNLISPYMQLSKIRSISFLAKEELIISAGIFFLVSQLDLSLKQSKERPQYIIHLKLMRVTDNILISHHLWVKELKHLFFEEFDL